MSVFARMVDWREPSRVRGLAMTTAILQACVLAFMIAGTHGWIVPLKSPTSTDYVSFYAAGALANSGAPAAAYDQSRHMAAEQKATAPGIPYQYFFNPPTYLLIMSPFARLPYLASFVVMQGVTLALWLLLAVRVAGGGSAAAAALVAVPSVWWVLGLGQNSFLSAGLMAAGTLLLPGRPLLAGMAFGALCYKPHLAVLVPVALVAARAWRAFFAAALTVATAVATSVALYGWPTWQAFFANAQRSVRGPIDSGRVLLAGRVDPTGALQLLGLPPLPARCGWAVCAVVAVVAVAWLWRYGGRETRAAGLAAAVLIAAPFVLMYDLVMASLAAAWLVRAGRRDGFLPGEKAGLGAAIVLDLLASHPIVSALNIPFGAVVGPILLGLAVRRAQHSLAQSHRENAGSQAETGRR